MCEESMKWGLKVNYCVQVDLQQTRGPGSRVSDLLGQWWVSSRVINDNESENSLYRIDGVCAIGLFGTIQCISSNWFVFFF